VRTTLIWGMSRYLLSRAGHAVQLLLELLVLLVNAALSLRNSLSLGNQHDFGQVACHYPLARFELPVALVESLAKVSNLQLKSCDLRPAARVAVDTSSVPTAPAVRILKQTILWAGLLDLLGPRTVLQRYQCLPIVAGERIQVQDEERLAVSTQRVLQSYRELP
jgi:hypothetical protein